ncbi:MAG: hypothetical protein ACXWDM_01525 [Nocardioides sp.]
MKQIRRRVTVVLATACAAVLTTTATYAEVAVVNDGADATASLTDIRRVRVDHGDQQLKVRVNFPDLRKRANAGLIIFVDKNRQRRGPEFGLATPLFSGSDYALLRMRRWSFSGVRVNCDYNVALKWKRDVLVFTADRGCFGEPDELRVGMRMRDDADASHPVTDWLIDRRKFTTWLSPGEALSATRA